MASIGPAVLITMSLLLQVSLGNADPAPVFCSTREAERLCKNHYKGNCLVLNEYPPQICSYNGTSDGSPINYLMGGCFCVIGKNPMGKEEMEEYREKVISHLKSPFKLQ